MWNPIEFSGTRVREIPGDRESLLPDAVHALADEARRRFGRKNVRIEGDTIHFGPVGFWRRTLQCWSIVSGRMAVSQQAGYLAVAYRAKFNRLDVAINFLLFGLLFLYVSMEEWRRRGPEMLWFGVPFLAVLIALAIWKRGYLFRAFVRNSMHRFAETRTEKPAEQSQQGDRAS